MKCEVIEIKTGARMSHQRGKGEMMGSTVFDTPDDATKWMAANGLTDKTHRVQPL